MENNVAMARITQLTNKIANPPLRSPVPELEESGLTRSETETAMRARLAETSTWYCSTQSHSILLFLMA